MADGICPFAEWRPVQPYEAGGEPKVGFCDHTAAGFYSTLRDPGFWNRAGYSVHFGISRKGEAVQLVSIFDRAWGQGRDARGLGVGPKSPGITWAPFAAMGQRSPNEYLISVEHEDAETVEGQTRFVPGSEWTPAQLKADLAIKRWCIEEVRRVQGGDLLRFGIDSLAGHYMFDPVSRAECPGRFWREQYRTKLFERLTGSDEGKDSVRPAWMIKPHFGRHTRFDGSKPVAVEGVFPVNLFEEMGMPPDARMVRIEVFKEPPNYIGISHGDSSLRRQRDGRRAPRLVRRHPGCPGQRPGRRIYGQIGLWEIRAAGYWA